MDSNKIICDFQEAKKELMTDATKGKILRKKFSKRNNFAFGLEIFSMLLTLSVGIIVIVAIFKHLDMCFISSKIIASIILSPLAFLLALCPLALICYVFEKNFVDPLEKEIKDLSDNAKYYRFLDKNKSDESEIAEKIKIENNKIIILEGSPLFDKFEFKDKYEVIKTDELWDTIDLVEKKIYTRNTQRTN